MPIGPSAVFIARAMLLIPVIATRLKFTKENSSPLNVATPRASAAFSERERVLSRSRVAKSTTANESLRTFAINLSNGMPESAEPTACTMPTTGDQSKATSMSVPALSNGKNASAMFCRAVTKLSFRVLILPARVSLRFSRPL